MDLINTNFEIIFNWRQTWADELDNDNPLCKISPGIIPTRFDLHCNLWFTFNKVHTSHGRCTDSLHK